MNSADRIRQFVADRGWQRYHSRQRSLALAICSEAGELAALYRWNESPDPDRVADEVADIAIFCISLCNRLNLDLEQCIAEKMDENESREWPELSGGRVSLPID